MDFLRLRAGLIINLPPAQGPVLHAAEAKLRRRLESSSMFTGVEVEATEDPDHLLVAMVRYRPGTNERRVASFLEAIWVTELRLEALDAFHFLVEDGHVELQSVTGDRAAHYFITLHLVAQEGSEDDFEDLPEPGGQSAEASGREGRRWWLRR